VACKKHGDSSGLLCCDHVCEAVYGSMPVLSFDVLRVNVLGDGSKMLEHMVCARCRV